MNILLVTILLFCVAVQCGCQAARGYPDRLADQDAEIQATANKYFATTASDVPPNYSTEAWRNEVVNGRMRVIDYQFTKFQRAISEESVNGNVGTDWAVLGLNGAGAIVGSAATKTVLHVVSAGIIGAKASVDRNVYFEKTVPALIAQMEALRKEQLATIRGKLRADAATYSMMEALADVEEYYKAGTVPAAIQRVVANAGATARDAETRLKEIAVASVEDVGGVDKMRATFNQWLRAARNADAAAAAARTEALGKMRGQVQALGAEVAADADTDAVANALNAEIRRAIDERGRIPLLKQAFGVP